LPVPFASSTNGRKPGNTAASSHRDGVSWRTPALEFLHVVWTKREMTHREELVWMAKQKKDRGLKSLRENSTCKLSPEGTAESQSCPN
jgi:hypothetical protein